MGKVIAGMTMSLDGFVATELDHPSGEFVLFSVRPDYWHSLDFSDATG